MLCGQDGLTIVSQRRFPMVTSAQADRPFGQRFHDLLLGMRTAVVRLGVASNAATVELLQGLRMLKAHPHYALAGATYPEITALAEG
jgi:hypothetical protein